MDHFQKHHTLILQNVQKIIKKLSNFTGSNVTPEQQTHNSGK